MTGFAVQSSAMDGFRWTWDIRAVNGKGLDIRLRVPDWIEGLETAIRPLIAEHVRRGNVTVSLRVARDGAVAKLSVNQEQLAAVIRAFLDIEREAANLGLSLGLAKASDIAVVHGVLEQSIEQDNPTELSKALLDDFPSVLKAFDMMRVSEGQSLTSVLSGQLDKIEALTERASQLVEERKDDVAASLKRNLARILDNSEGLDHSRLEQELALLAVKADITEEIDRLVSHVAAARELLGEAQLVGRKMDFLMQEFN
ncbi:MAG TPA: YicC family protein, partial [Rhodobacteraceae bacterium]|nr:YicC family protein [Paracoccaceae bacterium]